MPTTDDQCDNTDDEDINVFQRNFGEVLVNSQGVQLAAIRTEFLFS